MVELDTQEASLQGFPQLEGREEWEEGSDAPISSRGNMTYGIPMA